MGERSADVLVENVLRDADAREALKTDPEGTLKNAATAAKLQLPLQTDRVVYRMVVLFLGVTVVGVVLGAIALTWIGKPNDKLPDILTALGSAAVGALAGMLAPTPRG